ncbi:MAG: rRNA maturation RNase YbeY [Planctomycetota bacterium]|nr:MAG: rRNA maturation RNase YbeY [Planctomycetota bacterium]
MKRRTKRARPRSRPRTAPSRVTIVVTGADAPLSNLVRRAARAALAAQGVLAGRLEIAVVGEARMRAVHAQWLADSSVTDVLTFDLSDGPANSVVDGQVLVCAPVARRRASERGIDWRHELLLYVVHGCLHLCGFDDRRNADAKCMHVREDQILRRIGVGPVYYCRKARTKAASAKGGR